MTGDTWHMTHDQFFFSIRFDGFSATICAHCLSFDLEAIQKILTQKITKKFMPKKKYDIMSKVCYC